MHASGDWDSRDPVVGHNAVLVVVHVGDSPSCRNEDELEL